MKRGKWLLIVFLIYLPFKWLVSTYLLKEWPHVALVVQSSDKFVLILGLIIAAVYRFYLKKSLALSEKYLVVPLILILIWDVVSGIVNKNPAWVTGAGAFYHLKNFLVVFVFSSFKWTETEIEKSYKILRNLALLFGLCAIAQEGLTLVSQLLYDDPSRLIYWPSAINEWRLGLYRAPSIVGHPNILGIYTLLFTVTEMFIYGSNRIFLLLTSSLYFTFSRMSYIVYTGIVALFIKKRYWLIFLLVWPVTYLYLTSQTTISEMSLNAANYNPISTQSTIAQSKFRGYVIKKSIEVWKDHKTFGVGPGMYGDIVSFVVRSPVYKNYEWNEYYLNFANIGKNLDHFYAVILAESGLISLFLFLLLFVTLSIIPFMLMREIKKSFVRDLMKGLIIFPAVISILLVANTINMTFLWFPYLAMLGMGISYAQNQEVSVLGRINGSSSHCDL